MRFPDLLVQIQAMQDAARMTELDLKMIKRDIDDLKIAMVRIMPESAQFFREHVSRETPDNKELPNGDPTLF